MDDFDGFMARAWEDHAGDPAGVAARLQTEGLAGVAAEAQIAPLAQLAHHVHGEHLGRWADGIALQRALAALAVFSPGGAGGQTVRRCIASLELSLGDADATAGLETSDRIRVAAMAAANLALRDTSRAAALFRQALADAEAARLPAADPATRGLAVTGNNLACVLEEKAGRSAAERELMIAAAQAGRTFWERAGGWLEVERAEYRLARTWLQAGDAACARVHAQRCLDIVAARDAPALERYFGWEALGLADRALGDSAGHRHAVAQARAAFSALDESGRAACLASLDALTAANGGAGQPGRAG